MRLAPPILPNRNLTWDSSKLPAPRLAPGTRRAQLAQSRAPGLPKYIFEKKKKKKKTKEEKQKEAPVWQEDEAVGRGLGAVAAVGAEGYVDELDGLGGWHVPMRERGQHLRPDESGDSRFALENSNIYRSLEFSRKVSPLLFASRNTSSTRESVYCRRTLAVRRRIDAA